MVFTDVGLRFVLHHQTFRRKQLKKNICLTQDELSMVKCLFLRYRNDNNAWLGETKDREIGYFKSEHVEEVMDENFDGRYKNVNTLSLLSRCFKLCHLV